jgi:hypothetical protein
MRSKWQIWILSASPQGAALPGQTKRKKPFFIEKKNQKTFTTFEPGYWNTTGQISKSFLLLFFKKEVLPSYPGSLPSIIAAI